MSDSKTIRDKAFAKRIETACEKHPRAPSGHGRQTWVRKALEEQFGLKVSPEAVRKWFAGEVRPRPNIMSQIATVLNVDEAWLSLGLTPTHTPPEKTKLNAMANGAINLVAGHIQLAGGSIAYPEESSEHDLFAIVKGRQRSVTVRLGTSESTFKLSVPVQTQTTIAVIPTVNPNNYRFFSIPSDLIQEMGDNRGGFTDLVIEQAEGSYSVAGKALPEIATFTDLDGVVRQPKPMVSKIVSGIVQGITRSARSKDEGKPKH